MELYTPLWAAGWYPKRPNLLCIMECCQLMYGCESLVCQKKHTSRINAVKIRVLRSMIGVWLSNRVRNEVRRKECGVKEVVTKIEKNMLRWFRYVERMDERRLTKEIYVSWPNWGSFREGPGQEYSKSASVYEEFDDSGGNEWCV
jgi:hypothetical protein